MARVNKADQTFANQAYLADRALTDKDAMAELVRITTPLALNLVSKIDLTGYSWDARQELTQEAILGIVESVHEFDPSFNVKFWTYAYYRIRKNLSQWMAQNSGAVSMPYEAWRTAKLVDEHEDFAERSLSERELSKLTGKHYARRAADARNASVEFDQQYVSVESDEDDTVIGFLSDLAEIRDIHQRFSAAAEFCELYGYTEFTAARMVVVAEELL